MFLSKGNGEFHGLYSPWGHKELDMTERLSLSLSTHQNKTNKNNNKNKSRDPGRKSIRKTQMLLTEVAEVILT